MSSRFCSISFPFPFHILSFKCSLPSFRFLSFPLGSFRFPPFLPIFNLVSIQFHFDFLWFPFNFLSIFSLFPFQFLSFPLNFLSSYQFLSMSFHVLSSNLVLISIFLFKSLFLSISFSCPFVSFQLLSVSSFILIFLFVSSIFL